MTKSVTRGILLLTLLIFVLRTVVVAKPQIYGIFYQHLQILCVFIVLINVN